MNESGMHWVTVPANDYGVIRVRLYAGEMKLGHIRSRNNMWETFTQGPSDQTIDGVGHATLEDAKAVLFAWGIAYLLEIQ